jgi:hypothetical protein
LQLEKKLGYKPSALERLRRWFLHTQPTFTYLGSILLITLLLLAILLGYNAAVQATPWQIIVALLTFIPATTMAVSLVNWLVSRLDKPSFAAQARSVRRRPRLLPDDGGHSRPVEPRR